MSTEFFAPKRMTTRDACESIVQVQVNDNVVYTFLSVNIQIGGLAIEQVWCQSHLREVDENNIGRSYNFQCFNLTYDLFCRHICYEDKTSQQRRWIVAHKVYVTTQLPLLKESAEYKFFMDKKHDSRPVPSLAGLSGETVSANNNAEYVQLQLKNTDFSGNVIISLITERTAELMAWDHTVMRLNYLG